MGNSISWRSLLMQAEVGTLRGFGYYLPEALVRADGDVATDEGAPDSAIDAYEKNYLEIRDTQPKDLRIYRNDVEVGVMVPPRDLRTALKNLQARRQAAMSKINDKKERQEKIARLTPDEFMALSREERLETVKSLKGNEGYQEDFVDNVLAPCAQRMNQLAQDPSTAALSREISAEFQVLVAQLDAVVVSKFLRAQLLLDSAAAAKNQTIEVLDRGFSTFDWLLKEPGTNARTAASLLGFLGGEDRNGNYKFEPADRFPRIIALMTPKEIELVGREIHDVPGGIGGISFFGMAVGGGGEQLREPLKKAMLALCDDEATKAMLGEDKVALIKRLFGPTVHTNGPAR